MNLNINELCKDPLFQLNLAIWLAQSQPLQHFYVYPLFYESKLNLYSIGPRLTLPLDIMLEAKEKINCQATVRPDLILATKEKKKLCILECKSSSFGPESSTAEQARTLLLISGLVISEVLAIGKRGENEGILCYFIGPNSAELMEKTLKDLEEEIRDKTGLETGNSGCFEIKPSQSAIILEYLEQIKTFLNLIKDSPVEVIQFEEDTDPRPLYFIPYDYSIMQQQTKKQQEFCRRVLFDRILSYVLSNIGGATIPTSITFTTDELLNSATFGVYEIWEDNDATKNIKRLVKDLLEDIKNGLNEPLKECVSYESQKGWIFNLKDREAQEELLKQLQKIKPETLDLSKKITPTLFDNLED